VEEEEDGDDDDDHDHDHDRDDDTVMLTLLSCMRRGRWRPVVGVARRRGRAEGHVPTRGSAEAAGERDDWPRPLFRVMMMMRMLTMIMMMAMLTMMMMMIMMMMMMTYRVMLGAQSVR
jgi:hypothetical protein